MLQIAKRFSLIILVAGLFTLLAPAVSAVEASPANITWSVDGIANPVIVGQEGFFDGRAYEPCVIYDEYAGIYRAWVSASSGRNLSYLESNGDDPTSWNYDTFAECLGVLTGDEGRCKSTVIQLAPDLFRIWYAGAESTPGTQIYTATSSDGVTWEPAPVDNDPATALPITGVTSDMLQFGVSQHFAPVWVEEDNMFYVVTQVQEDVADPNNPDDGQVAKQLNLYKSRDGIAWTWICAPHFYDGGQSYTEPEFPDDPMFEPDPPLVTTVRISQIVKAPNRFNTWYAFGFRDESYSSSFVSTDNMRTWVCTEAVINNVGAMDHDWNAQRTQMPRALYRGDGNWVLFQSVKTSEGVYSTAVAEGTEVDIPEADLTPPSSPGKIGWYEGLTNPVIVNPGSSGGTQIADGRAYETFVLYDEVAGKYRALYSASSGADVTYCESVGDNPREWTGHQRVQLEGALDMPSDYNKAGMAQLADGSFRVWCMSVRGSTPGYSVATFTSADGLNWYNEQACTGLPSDDSWDANGPAEHFCPVYLGEGLGFYALSQTQEPDQGFRQLNKYSSDDGIAWTFEGGTNIPEFDITHITIHPDLENVWYAFGRQPNNTNSCVSLVSSDAGENWAVDEGWTTNMNTIGSIGAAGTFNDQRNFIPHAIYRGEGNWVFFRSTRGVYNGTEGVYGTAYATGLELGATQRTGVGPNWTLYE